MKVNEGKTDRIVRVVVGLGLLAGAYQTQTQWMYVVGGILLATGAIGFCGLYTLLGINTCPMKKK
jgi:hypothetical protein